MNIHSVLIIMKTCFLELSPHTISHLCNLLFHICIYLIYSFSFMILLFFRVFPWCKEQAEWKMEEDLHHILSDFFFSDSPDVFYCSLNKTSIFSHISFGNTPLHSLLFKKKNIHICSKPKCSMYDRQFICESQTDQMRKKFY